MTIITWMCSFAIFSVLRIKIKYSLGFTVYLIPF